MDLRVLRYFVTVAREECLNSAALKLKITQPTLSRQLKELEEEFGAQLFNRGSRGQRITLTEKGALLRRRAEEMLQLAEKTCCELSCGECVSGNIYIGVGVHDSLALKTIGEAFVRLHEEYPEVGLNLEQGGSCALYDRLSRGSLDFALLPEQFTCSSLEILNFPKAPLVQSLGVYLGRQQATKYGNSITAQDLILTDLAMPEDEDEYEILQEWLEQASGVPRISVHYSSLADALCTLNSSSFAVLGRRLEGISDDWNFVPLEPALYHTGALCHLKRGTLSPASSRFIKIFKELLQHDSVS